MPPIHLSLITLAPWTSLLSLTTSFCFAPPPTAQSPECTLSNVTSDLQLTSNCQSKEHCSTLTLQDFILLTSLLFEILSSFGFPSALQPQQSPLTSVFLFSHLINTIFPTALNVLQSAVSQDCVISSFIFSLLVLSLDDFIFTCSFYLDIWCQAPWISSPDFCQLALQLSRGQLKLYAPLLPEILQYWVTALEPFQTWSKFSFTCHETLLSS